MPADRRVGLGIDAQRLERGRKRLFSLVGQLAEAYSRRSGRPYLTKKLATIIDVALAQFAAEEAAMTEAGYAHLASHRAAHGEVADHLTEIAADYRVDARDFIIAEFAEFFRDWLVLHGAAHDAPFLACSGTGANWARCA